MTRGTRTGRALLRVGAALALLAWAAHAALSGSELGAWAALGSAWVEGAGAAFSWLAVACGVFGLSFAVAALRFRTLLVGGGVPARYGVLLRATIVASFFNVVVPGGLAGDAYRVVDVRVETGRGAEALGLVVLERILSLAALGTLCAAAVPAGGEPVAIEDDGRGCRPRDVVHRLAPVTHDGVPVVGGPAVAENERGGLDSPVVVAKSIFNGICSQDLGTG